MTFYCRAQWTREIRIHYVKAGAGRARRLLFNARRTRRHSHENASSADLSDRPIIAVVFSPDARENGLSGNTRESVWNKFVEKNRKKFINVVRNVVFKSDLFTCLYNIFKDKQVYSHGRFCEGGATIRLLRAFRSRLARRNCIKLHVTQ